MTSRILQKVSLINQLQRERGISCIYFNKKMQKLILFNNKITKQFYVLFIIIYSMF